MSQSTTETVALGVPARPSLAPSHRPLERLGAKLALAIVGLGFLVIGLGWLGASGSGGQVGHVQRIEAEFPYLLSGGCVGIGLCLLGSALLIAQSQRRDREQLEASLGARLDEIAQLLREQQVLAASGGGSIGADPDAGSLVAAGASAYHLTACRLVNGKAATLLTRRESAERGLRPCRYCKPG